MDVISEKENWLSIKTLCTFRSVLISALTSPFFYPSCTAQFAISHGLMCMKLFFGIIALFPTPDSWKLPFPLISVMMNMIMINENSQTNKIWCCYSKELRAHNTLWSQRVIWSCLVYVIVFLFSLHLKFDKLWHQSAKLLGAMWKIFSNIFYPILLGTNAVHNDYVRRNWRNCYQTFTDATRFEIHLPFCHSNICHLCTKQQY